MILMYLGTIENHKTSDYIKLVFKILIILSTSFMFFQTANIIKINYLLIVMLFFSLISINLKQTWKPRNLLGYFVMLLLMAISLTYTINMSLTLTYLCVIIFGLFYYITFLTHSNSLKLQEYVAKVIIWFSLINVFITLLSVIFPSTVENLISMILPGVNTNFEFASGILGQTGTNSYVISFSIIYLATTLIMGTEKKFLTIAALILSCVALVFTGKRGPVLWVVLTVLIINCVCFYCSKNKNIKWILYYLLFSVITIAVYFSLSSNELFMDALGRFSELKEIDEDYSRVRLYTAAWEHFKENPYFGLGAGAYSHYGMGAHNDYLQILAENGIFCSALFFAFIIKNLLTSFKKYRQLQSKENLFFLGMQLFFIFNAMTGTSFLHYGFFFIYIQTVGACNNINVEFENLGERYA